MSKSFTRQWLQLSAIWVLIAFVPIGRLYLNDQLALNVGFYLVIVIIGLILTPLFILWLSYLQRRNLTWFAIILIQLSISVLLSLSFYYAVKEHPGIVKSRTSASELASMDVIDQIRFYFFSGNSYSIFASLMMLSGLGLLIVYSGQLRQRKLRHEEFERDYLLNNPQSKLLYEKEQPTGKKIAIKTGKRYDLIEPADIMYASADGNYCDIKLNNGEHFLHRITITDLLALLPQEKFMRIHQSYLVSIAAASQVKRLQFGELQVIMHNGQSLKVSRRYKKQVARLTKP